MLSVNGPLSSSLYLKRFHPLTLKSFVQPCCKEASAGRVWRLRGERLASSATTETTNSNGNNNQKRLQHSAITKYGNFTSLFVTLLSPLQQILTFPRKEQVLKLVLSHLLEYFSQKVHVLVLPEYIQKVTSKTTGTNKICILLFLVQKTQYNVCI